MQSRSRRPTPTRERREPRGRYLPRRRVCGFCVEKAATIDYKDVGRLRRFVSERGKIETRRRSGNCAKHQRAMARALKRARHLSLIPYTGVHLRDTGAIAITPQAVPSQEPG